MPGYRVIGRLTVTAGSGWPEHGVIMGLRSFMAMYTAVTVMVTATAGIIGDSQRSTIWSAAV